MRRDLQEYDMNDVFNEVLDDIASYDGLHEWVLKCPDGPDWDRAANSFAWDGSVFRQWVDWVCDDRINSDEVFDHLVMYASDVLDTDALMVYEADNYNHMTSRDDAERVFGLVEIWKGEGVI